MSTGDTFRFPLRVVQDMKGAEAYICNASNRIIADKMTTRDACEIVEVLNTQAGYTVPNWLYLDKDGNG